MNELSISLYCNVLLIILIKRQPFLLSISDENQILSTKSEASLGNKLGSQIQTSFPLKVSMLAKKYKTYANAKFVSLTQESKAASESER